MLPFFLIFEAQSPFTFAYPPIPLEFSSASDIKLPGVGDTYSFSPTEHVRIVERRFAFTARVEAVTLVVAPIPE
jgi:hypothetical protein